jgi:WD40 repeat protein
MPRRTAIRIFISCAHSDSVNAVALSPDGRRAVSGSHDTTLKVWDLERGRELRKLEGHSHWVNTVAVSPDGRRAVSGSVDQTLRVWDLETGHELRVLEGKSGRGYCLSWRLPSFPPQGRLTSTTTSFERS